MRKGSSVIGQDVLSLETGQRLHSVKGVVINEANDDIVALVLDEGGLFSSTLVVPVEAVSSFGKDAVVIPNAEAVGRVSDFPEIKPLVERRGQIAGRKVFTEAGEDRGTIKDMYFDEQTGRVVGFEISGGAVDDLADGTSFLSIAQVVRTGPEIVYIEPETVAAIDGEAGGSASGSLGPTDRLRQDPEAAVIGLRSQAEISDETGSIVIARGERITPDHIERARATGNLPVLLQSVRTGTSPETGQHVADATEAAGDKASGLWDAFTRKLSELTDAQGKKMDEEHTKRRLQQIEDAVGRPVMKVILDRQDNVVLNLGDIITHEAVQKAYDANALDSLLGAVYKGEVTFERDEMKASVEGQATVEKATGDAPIVDELQQKVETAELERQQQKEAKAMKAEADRQQREDERSARAAEREGKARQPDRLPGVADSDGAADRDATPEGSLDKTVKTP